MTIIGELFFWGIGDLFVVVAGKGYRGSRWYHFFPEGEQVSARPRFFLTCIALDIRRQWFQLIFEVHTGLWASS